jgi:hypothetical protein
MQSCTTALKGRQFVSYQDSCPSGPLHSSFELSGADLSQNQTPLEHNGDRLFGEIKIAPNFIKILQKSLTGMTVPA